MLCVATNLVHPVELTGGITYQICPFKPSQLGCAATERQMCCISFIQNYLQQSKKKTEKLGIEEMAGLPPKYLEAAAFPASIAHRLPETAAVLT